MVASTNLQILLELRPYHMRGIGSLSHQTHVSDPAVDTEQLMTQTSIHRQYLHPKAIKLETKWCMLYAGR